MTRPPFRPTHELRLTNRHRRGSTANQYPAPMTIRVMLDGLGNAWTAEEAAASAPAPDWRCDDLGVWSWRGSASRLPEGYTDLRVRRLNTRGRTAMGPTVTRSPTEPTAAKLTVGGTRSEIAMIREAARLDGKRPGPWVRDQVLPVAEQRVESKRKR